VGYISPLAVGQEPRPCGGRRHVINCFSRTPPWMLRDNSIIRHVRFPDEDNAASVVWQSIAHSLHHTGSSVRQPNSLSTQASRLLNARSDISRTHLVQTGKRKMIICSIIGLYSTSKPPLHLTGNFRASWPEKWTVKGDSRPPIKG
jgi:hypothetical protein